MHDVPLDGFPVLSRGRHRDWRQGANLLELASLLAGQRWSARPRTVDPVLAVVAGAVLAATSDEGIAALAPLAPDLIGTRTGEGTLGPRVVAACATDALADAPCQRRAELTSILADAERCLGRTARSQGRRGPFALLCRRLRGARYRRRSRKQVRALFGQLRVVAGGQGDARLRALLGECIGLARGFTGDRPVRPGGHR